MFSNAFLCLSTAFRHATEKRSCSRLSPKKGRAAVVEEELNRLPIQPKCQRLHECDVIRENFLIIPIKVSADDRVDMVVAEEVEQCGLALDVLDENAHRLQELHLHY